MTVSNDLAEFLGNNEANIEAAKRALSPDDRKELEARIAAQWKAAPANG